MVNLMKDPDYLYDKHRDDCIDTAEKTKCEWLGRIGREKRGIARSEDILIRAENSANCYNPKFKEITRCYFQRGCSKRP